jgi:hypothetical protein
MAKKAKRLHRRLLETVAATQMPQLQRGQDDEVELEEVDQAYRDKAHAGGHSLPDKSYPILDTKRLHSAAVLAASHHGDWKAAQALIRREAKRLGVDVTTLPGFGKKSKSRESAALRILIREADIRKTGNTYEATVIREGAGNAEDRNYYTREALRQAVAAGLFEGLQCYANHPTASEERDRPERDVRQLVGHFREARYSEDSGVGQVRAKFIPISGPGYEWVTSLIESALGSVPNRPLIGISIDGYGHAPDQQEINGRTYSMVREVTHLGSADIVTRAGAGGQFHRRLQEAWRNTTPAEQRPGDTSQEEQMKAAKLQEKIKAAAGKLEQAAGLKDDDENGQKLVDEALTTLRECATAKIEPEVKIQEKIVEKPVAASDEEKDQLATRLEETETKLRESETERKQERSRRKDAESKLAEFDKAKLAAKVLREAEVSEKAARSWFDELVEQDDEQAMRTLVERKKAERDELLADLRESFGVEGAGPRPPALAGSGTPSGGLLERMGIDRDELAAA